MGLVNKIHEAVDEVDVIIAGGMFFFFEPCSTQTGHGSSQHMFPGGTAACVVAGRLAEADPELSILVIEGGQDNYNVPNVVNPLLFYQHLLPTSKTALFYKAKASDHLAGRESVVPSGGTLGGGSSINFMMYGSMHQNSDRTQGNLQR